MSGQKEKSPVGYRNPPQATQFKKGVSGNPKGRPKKKREPLRFGDGHVEAAFRRSGLRELTLNEGGRLVTMPIVEALMRSLQLQGMKGNRLAAQLVIDQLHAADTKARETREQSYEFWTNYKAEAAAEPEPKSCSHIRSYKERSYPHPDDVIIDHERRQIAIIGPIDVYDAERYERKRLLCMINLGYAELAKRRLSTDDPNIFRLMAHYIHELQPPSYGGDDVYHLTSMAITWTGLGRRQIEARMASLKAEIDALAPQDVGKWLDERRDRMEHSTSMLERLADSLEVASTEASQGMSARDDP